MHRVLTAIGACGLAITAHAGPIQRCPSDLNGDGIVSGFDLAFLLAAWGPCPEGELCAADLDGSGTVNGVDLDVLLGDWGFCPGVAATATELAGNSLSAYPFFEYVRAFNQGSEIEIAIDQTRFPFIAGKTCDLYIVNKKTPAQWAADPSLTDVTGGFQTETFVAGTIQVNTFTISGSSGLNGTTGTQIGIGYDMVCDCDQNGMLSTSDYIDGLSDEAGLYVVRNTAAAGPHPVTELTYVVTPWTGTAGFESENTFYPTNIASLGPRPLIIMGHGNGHNYQWYDHLGNHMASYGYVFMSHENNTVPGVFAASTTTLQHTDTFVAQVTSAGAPSTAVLAPLDNLVDVDQIIWMGHSRGGEGVAIAYDRVFDGVYVPTGWELSDIKLVSSVFPVDFQGGSGNPGFVHRGNYHLWTASADCDVNGCASCNLCQTFHLHDRAEQNRASVVLQGTGHGHFHNFPSAGACATGPCLMTFPKAHAIIRGYLLPLAEHFRVNDIPSRDFLTRQWESFKPIGAPATAACAPPSGSGVDVVVNMTYREGDSAGNFVIDDFQTQTDTGTSSSGGAVTLTDLSDVFENRNDDGNADFTWSVADLMNSITLAGAGDTSRGLTFSWTGAASIEWAVVAAQQDLTDDTYLSFRAAQASRNPNTTAALADLTFDVVLRDGGGTTSRINIGAYGGGVEEPYQRTSCGVGAGWAAEHEVIRLRLSDFLNNGSGLDLSAIVAVRFEFGGAGTSLMGRINMDELTLTAN